MDETEVLRIAKRAISNGATRICLGAAWRAPRDDSRFEAVLRMISKISALGAEVCCTLGMLTPSQALRLKEAGLYAYNHNLDTSEEFYPNVITTRTYQDRLRTLDHVEESGMQVCCGCILGMGETAEDRIGFLHALAKRPKPPSSIPINILVPMKGTPMEHCLPLSSWEMIRMVATARIVFPASHIRLSAGRKNRPPLELAFCFLAGANSIHTGEKLLTSPNPSFEEDMQLLELLGLEGTFNNRMESQNAP